MISKARGYHSLISTWLTSWTGLFIQNLHTDLKSSRENYGQSSNDFFVSADQQTSEVTTVTCHLTFRCVTWRI